jgi:lipopolysaccharide transport system permease protein
MSKSWDLVVDADKRGSRTSLRQIWYYRDLLFLLVRRDFVSFYKQTVLGPAWFFFKPIFSSIVYLFIFSELAGLSSDGIPPILFYISGLTAWSYFSETVLMISGVLKANEQIFGKVYFPRLIVPLSILFSNMIKLGIQMFLIFALIAYYTLYEGLVGFQPTILLIPGIIFIIALQAFGIGLIVASISIKYRDISMLIGYALQLGLFITPVVFPLSSTSGNFRLFLSLNPMTQPIELFKYAFFNTGSFSDLANA